MLFLFVSLASGSTLLRYFARKKIDFTEADEILRKLKVIWPTGVLNTKSLRKCLEAAEHYKVRFILGKLIKTELDTVLDVMLHPPCTGEMLKNLKQATVDFKTLHRATVLAHVFIHQPWKDTKSMLAVANGDADALFLNAASALVLKAFKRGRFTLIRSIFNAVNQECVQLSVNLVLMYILGEVSHSRALIELFIMNDKGGHITSELFRVLSKTKTPTTQDFVKIFEHPFVGEEQFAKIINALLSSEYSNWNVTRDLVYITGNFDIPALKQHIESHLQKNFLHYFGAVSAGTDSVWPTIPLKRQDRHEEWYKQHVDPILRQLQMVERVLPKVIHRLISEYAA